MDKEDYNNELVFYCKACLSLKIRYTNKLNYCDKCGSTDIAQCSIEDWERLYENKYGFKYLNK